MKPSYSYLSAQDWDDKIRALDSIASSCTLCPRKCKVDRLLGSTGFCGAPSGLVISSIFPHHGEEPPLSGRRGSGTVFFTYCTLKCCFCQNYQLSHHAEGRPYSPSELAAGLLDLQAQGCHNINLVTATHFLPWVARSLKEAALNGLAIPIVYNCGGYESASTMALLNGVVEVYLPDMKYGNNLSADRYSKAPDYVETNRSAIREMFRQVGPLRLDDEGIASRGLCIRHLVLPEKAADSDGVIGFLTSAFDPHDISISLMAQYRPLFNACRFPEINRSVTREEYEPIKNKIVDAGFNGFFQELEKIDDGFVIDFKKRKRERLTGDL
jgi:putative pyruvate formate lyase activating enzyme